MLYSLLLAGGKSSRMGQDKRQLQFDDQTLLDRSLALLESTGSDRILISGQVEGYDTIQDILAGCGPLGGLHAALHHLENGGELDGSLLLVVPVDMPMLDTDTLSRLVVNIGDRETCHYDGEIFPCVFRLTPLLKIHLDKLFADSTLLGGERSMKSLLRAFSEQVVSTSELPDDVFLNLNRPEDWQKFLAMMA